MKSLHRLRRLFLLLLLLSLVACSSRKIRSEPSTDGLLFPYGTYQHNVKIKMVQNVNSGPKEFAFSGVVQVNRGWVKIAILSPFGTTLVKIQEERESGKVEFLSYVESFKKFESKFKDYYSILKSLLFFRVSESMKNQLHVSSKNSAGLPERAETLGLEQNASFYFRKYDEHGIPEDIVIEHPRINIEILVSGYDL